MCIEISYRCFFSLNKSSNKEQNVISSDTSVLQPTITQITLNFPQPLSLVLRERWSWCHAKFRNTYHDQKCFVSFCHLSVRDYFNLSWDIWINHLNISGYNQFGCPKFLVVVVNGIQVTLHWTEWRALTNRFTKSAVQPIVSS